MDIDRHDIAQVDAVDCCGHISRSGFLPRHLAGAGMEPEPQRKPTPCKKQIRLLLRRMADSIAQRFPIADSGIPGEGRIRLRESARGGGAWAQCAKAVQQSPFPGVWLDFSGFYDIMYVISYKRTVDAVTHRRAFKYFYCEVSDMKKAASIFLRTEIGQRDIELMIRWMDNPNITRYLNEDPHIVYALRQLSMTVPAPMLTYHFNRAGHFFLVCLEEGGTVGFVKLYRLPESGTYEIVYVIGEESLWGRGFGESAIRAALAKAFLEWQAEKIIAKIVPQNQRSIRSVHACGFRQNGTEGQFLRYSITTDAYLQQLRA